MRDVIADRLLASPGRIRLTKVMAVALLVLLAASVLALVGDLYGWEESTTRWAIDLPDGLEPVFRVSMQLGAPLTVAAIALLFLIVDRPRRASIVLVAGGLAWLTSQGAKALIGRPRPSADVLGFSPEEFVNGNGFPSAHATIASALALVIVTTFAVPKLVKVLAVAAAVLTVVARLHLAVHWPLDVIGGAALGVLVAGLAVAALDPAPIPSAWPGVGCWPPVPEVDAGALMAPGRRLSEFELRLATFNIRNGRAFDGKNSWPFRRRATAAAIAALEADLVGMQEVYGFQRRWLERQLPGWHWVGAGRTDGQGRGEQCPIAWRGDHLRLEDWKVRWFSETPTRAGSRYPGGQFPRIATLARFLDLDTGLRFGVMNAHLDSSLRHHRVMSAELMSQWLDEHDLVWIVLGDLNTIPDSEPIRILTAAGLHAVEPAGDLGTAHQFTGRVDGRRIDHILVAEGLRATAAEVTISSEGERLPSDHWPLVADVAMDA